MAGTTWALSCEVRQLILLQKKWEKQSCNSKMDSGLASGPIMLFFANEGIVQSNKLVVNLKGKANGRTTPWLEFCFPKKRLLIAYPEAF